MKFIFLLDVLMHYRLNRIRVYVSLRNRGASCYGNNNPSSTHMPIHEYILLIYWNSLINTYNMVPNVILSIRTKQSMISTLNNRNKPKNIYLTDIWLDPSIDLVIHRFDVVNAIKTNDKVVWSIYTKNNNKSNTNFLRFEVSV